MASALVTRTDSLPAEREWATMLSMAEVLFKSGMLPAHIKSAAATVAIVQKGRELGIPPMHALSNIAVIQGKPTANSELMLALIYRDHGDDAIQFGESTAELCTIGYKRRGWSKPKTHSFTIHEAKQAGLLKNATWTQYPAAMLRARCVSAVARMGFPDSIGGMYLPEEMGAEVDGDGQVVAPPPAPIRAIAQPEPDDSQPQMESQRKRMWATARDKGWKPEQIHQLLTVEFPEAINPETKKASTTALNRGDMARLIEIVSTPPPFAEVTIIVEDEGEVVGEQAALISE